MGEIPGQIKWSPPFTYTGTLISVTIVSINRWWSNMLAELAFTCSIELDVIGVVRST